MVDLFEEIAQADYCLIGLGEEFEDRKRIKDDTVYIAGEKLLKDKGMPEFINPYREYCSKMLPEDRITQALEKLRGLLGEKETYVVSVATDTRIAGVEWKQEKLVMPCGRNDYIQCGSRCRNPETMTDEQKELLHHFFDNLYRQNVSGDCITNCFKECTQCHNMISMNNVSNRDYDERGYLEKWEEYTKWLQRTINRKLLILELGVGMKYPTVIRWPFEKIAYFNQKASFVRVNETLPQLTEELAVRGTSVPQNAIDWILGL